MKKITFPNSTFAPKNNSAFTNISTWDDMFNKDIKPLITQECVTQEGEKNIYILTVDFTSSYPNLVEACGVYELDTVTHTQETFYAETEVFTDHNEAQIQYRFFMPASGFIGNTTSIKYHAYTRLVKFLMQSGLYPDLDFDMIKVENNEG